ncbi:fancJ-like protein isoform X3 [Bombyx mori]|uniref:DNA 5'-3' helicase n=1 Tax=Bombyx mori TaxID=7091 RepID=A0A8R2M2S1_BOMMO|nr:fancJ-like protein isoform X1 [Bombyx mori]
MSSPIVVLSSSSSSLEETGWESESYSPFKGKPTVKSTKKSEVIKKLFTKEKSPDGPSKQNEITIMIAGVKVNLPVNPYGTQKALIHQVIKTIKAGQNCLLESPTGSGKTLALLCGTLAWLQAEKERINKLQMESCFEEIFENKMDDSAGNANNRKHVDNPFTFEVSFAKPEYGKKSIYSSPKKSDSPPKHYAMSSGSPDTNTMGTHGATSIDEEQSQTRKKYKAENITNISDSPRSPSNSQNPPKHERVPVVYYGTRTHKQLQQVIKEFKRTVYCKEIRMSILAGRDRTCLMPFDRKIWKTKDDMCAECIKTKSSLMNTSSPQTSSCKFYDNRMSLTHSNLPPAFDIEDLVEAGAKLKACPYFAAKSMAAKAKIIFCPYNYLINPFIRERMRINLADNIVVIDEGHNIEDICRDEATCTIERRRISEAVDQLQYAKRYVKMGQDEAARGETIDFFIKTLQIWDKCLIEQSDRVSRENTDMWNMNEFMAMLNENGIGQNNYHNFNFHLSKLLRMQDDLYGVGQHTIALLETMDSALGYLFKDECKHAEDFVPMLLKGDDSRALYRRRSYTGEFKGANISIRLLCMSPAVLFEGLTKARSIILASGTLSPVGSMKHELGAEFNVSCLNHVISRERVWIGTLRNCESSEQLKCTKDNMEKKQVQDSIGKAILRVCDVTPHGVLCFHSSYTSMRLLHQRWQQTGLWDKLNSLKYIFKESDNTTDHDEIMKEYYSAAEVDRGAILFAVYRGKVSEGMDFRDRQARAVVTIGVPFPTIGDKMVTEKMKYNDKHSNGKKLMRGWDWYNVQAFRAMNQAIGRCVRHLNDWGAVLMIDERIAEQRNLEYLSKWVRDFLGNNHFTFDELMHRQNSLTRFMENMSKE